MFWERQKTSISKEEIMKFAVPMELLQRVLDYLAERPYREVFELVQGLQQQAQQIPEAKPVEAPKLESK